MQIAPLSAMGLTNQSLTPNTTYNSAQTAAESSQFAAMLKDLKEKAAGADLPRRRLCLAQRPGS